MNETVVWLAIPYLFLAAIIAQGRQCTLIMCHKKVACVLVDAPVFVGMEFTIDSCVRGDRFSKEFCSLKVGEELACL